MNGLGVERRKKGGPLRRAPQSQRWESRVTSSYFETRPATGWRAVPGSVCKCFRQGRREEDLAAAGHLLLCMRDWALWWCDHIRNDRWLWAQLFFPGFFFIFFFTLSRLDVLWLIHARLWDDFSSDCWCWISQMNANRRQPFFFFRQAIHYTFLLCWIHLLFCMGNSRKGECTLAGQMRVP